MWMPGFNGSGLFYNLCNLVATLHKSHNETRTGFSTSVCLLFSQLPHWLNLTWVPWADCSCWMLTANCWLTTTLVWTRLLVAYSLLLWSLHVSGLTISDLSKSTLLSRSSGLVREHLVQGFSLSSTQRWLACSVGAEIQQFSLCCLGTFIGSGVLMYLLLLKYAFW
jgi:hypothetical protein